MGQTSTCAAMSGVPRSRARPGDVTGVGMRVGYESPSQFSREYRRQFGLPPSQDAIALRDAPTGRAPALL